MGNLNKIIAYILAKHSEHISKLWLQYSPITESVDMVTDIQKANHFLRIQLGLLEVDTTEARECLTTPVDLSDWTTDFEEVVAPVILRHGLPIWNNN